MRSGRHAWRASVVALAIAVTGLPATGALAQAGRERTPRLVVEEGVTQPVFGYANADPGVRLGGHRPRRRRRREDRPRRRRHRPAREPGQHGPQGPRDHGRQPVLLLLRARQREPAKTYDARRRRSSSSRCSTTTTSCRAATPSSRVDLAGTNRSDGCVDVGGRSDIQSAKAVIDWLNGRATGYTTPHRHRPASAAWTNGRTGMIGKSWDGTIANGVAATGVEGLKTIVPISRHLLLVRLLLRQGRPADDSARTGSPTTSTARPPAQAAPPCSRSSSTAAPRTGDYNAFWTERDYVQGRRARSGPASSWSTACRTSTSAPSTSASGGTRSPSNGVERKIWLSQTGHVDPFDFRRAAWVDTLHRWFDH